MNQKPTLPHSNHPQAIRILVEGTMYIPKAKVGNQYDGNYLCWGRDDNDETVAFTLPANTNGANSYYNTDVYMLSRRVNCKQKQADYAARKLVEKIEEDDIKLSEPYCRFFNHGPQDFAPEHPMQGWRDVARVLAYNERYMQYINKNKVLLFVDPASFQNLPLFQDVASFEKARKFALGACPHCQRQPWKYEGDPMSVSCDGDSFMPHPKWEKMIPIPFNPTLPGYAHPNPQQQLMLLQQALAVATI